LNFRSGAAVAWHTIGTSRSIIFPGFFEQASANTGAPFGILGVPIARDAALVEAGGDLQLGPQTKVGVSYFGQLANNARDHSVKANFSWRF
jgi:outer membrane autotransporter protein